MKIVQYNFVKDKLSLLPLLAWPEEHKAVKQLLEQWSQFDLYHPSLYVCLKRYGPVIANHLGLQIGYDIYVGQESSLYTDLGAPNILTLWNIRYERTFKCYSVKLT